ncbi:DUF7125 family protein [Halosegnis longus]|uniref:RecA-superfamily ATPase, KaiC/GvpD/RAD55 family n=1 Tax=Halosegnis longus TaxID=2216012 RepID=A0AAJ4UV97_9EURY|nr:hypothetical protein [Halosegnis longus]RNJ25748.1 hypothetical protein Nmn1133_02950 [Salella cibi]
MPERFDTGTGPLDRELDGGFTAGTLAAYVASPAEQAETLLFQLATRRPTTYVTTVTPPEKVESTVESMAGMGGVDGLEVVSFRRGDSVESLLDSLSVREETFVIVDAVNALEHADPPTYHDFLTQFAQRLQATDSVGILHAVAGNDLPTTRDWTLRAADLILRLTVDYTSIEPETLLRIQKTRGKRPPDEALKIKLGQAVEIDTSWDM